MGKLKRYILIPCSLYYVKKFLDFSGGPVVKILYFQFREHGYDLWLGKFCMPHSVAKIKFSMKMITVSIIFMVRKEIFIVYCAIMKYSLSS